MPKIGPDLSHHQKTVDLTRAKSAVDFVFLKATQDTDFVDETFTSRWQQLADLGIPRGAYHFAILNKSAAAQAAHFVSVVQRSGFTARDAAILDMEDQDSSRGISAADLRAWVDRWVADVRQALPVRDVVFYVGLSYWNDLMGSPAALPANTLGWLCRYNEAGPYAPPHDRPAAWPDPPDIWQFTDGTDGRVHDIPGIGTVDTSEMAEACFTRLFQGMAAALIGPNRVGVDMQILRADNHGPLILVVGGHRVAIDNDQREALEKQGVPEINLTRDPRLYDALVSKLTP